MQMTDHEIVGLLWARDEKGLAGMREQYSAYCYGIAYHILQDRQDSEECENDTYLAAWNAIPPERPRILGAYLGGITRNLSLKRLRQRSTQKRGGGEAVLSFDELMSCVPAGQSFEETLQTRELARLLNRFLYTLPEQERRVFLCRYWYCDSILDICRRFGYGKSKVKMMLLRTRKKLSEYLQKEGVFVAEE
jgi:RNA polymerase sigma-70 factor (ECF subfamily)